MKSCVRLRVFYAYAQGLANGCLADLDGGSVKYLNVNIESVQRIDTAKIDAKMAWIQARFYESVDAANLTKMVLGGVGVKFITRDCVGFGVDVKLFRSKCEIA